MAQHQIESDCGICHELWDLLPDRTLEGHILIGSSEDIKSIKCPGHAPLFQAFAEYCNKELTSVNVGRYGPTSSVMVRESEKGGCYWPLLPVHKPQIPSHKGTGRVLDPQWADLEHVKKWKYKCFAEHGDKCRNSMRIWKARPAWVVDVENRCVVPGDGIDSFVGLSYGWGKESPVARVADTMAKL